MWTSGELLGHGLRNSVGLTLSRDQSKLWTVENSADQLDWRGADIHQVRSSVHPRCFTCLMTSGQSCRGN